jgi:quercetin dioxygenase-like cupin family protein
MHVYRVADGKRVEPPGHFGHLEVSDVVNRATGGNFMAQLSYCPPGGGGEMHHHDEDAQLFLVIEGELGFDTKQGRFTLGPLEAVFFEPMEQHATFNESSVPSVSVVVTVRSP